MYGQIRILTFLGRSPNAVAVKCPMLIKPETRENGNKC
jgi:hypothetical protein